MPPIMRFLIVCAFFYHYNSVFAFLDYEDVGVVVLSHLSHTWIQFQTLARFRAAWDHVRVNTLHDPTLFSILHSIAASSHSQYFAPYQIHKRAFLGEDRLLHNRHYRKEFFKTPGSELENCAIHRRSPSQDR